MKNYVSEADNYNTHGLFRLPWSMSDNVSTWLEITRDCDITCEYCVQGHNGKTHKSMEQLRFEMKELMRMRKCDAMIIAGGEPLIHPDIVEVVKLVKTYNVKPMIITNGVTLDEKLLRTLKKAGLFGCILHIDSGQNRPNWKDKTELELNELRQDFADMFHRVGGMICSFITTITPRALSGVADIIEWTTQNSDTVRQNIFIPVRGWQKDDPWDCYVGGKKVKLDNTAYCQDVEYTGLTAKDICNEIEKVIPKFSFCSFLGGTEMVNAPKWLVGFHLNTDGVSLGSLGPKSMELLQSFNHWFTGRYISFPKPWLYKAAKAALPLAIFDNRVRKVAINFLKVMAKNPLALFNSVNAQVIIVMQPFDILKNGECDMCDGCPNKTYHDGRLVSECRMEEYLTFGKLIEFHPKKVDSNK
jgi:Radical SAM superfamily/4Fe-4S single cluster domain